MSVVATLWLLGLIGRSRSILLTQTGGGATHVSDMNEGVARSTTAFVRHHACSKGGAVVFPIIGRGDT